MIKDRDRRDANNILKAITSSCTPKRSRDLPGLEVSSSCISASLSASPISSRYLKRKKGKKTIFKFNRYSSGNFFEKKNCNFAKNLFQDCNFLRNFFQSCNLSKVTISSLSKFQFNFIPNTYYLHRSTKISY